MVTVVNVYDAKTHLSKLLARVEAGEEIVIARAGRPIARLVAYEEPRQHRPYGLSQGSVWISPDFDEPLPEFEEYTV